MSVLMRRAKVGDLDAIMQLERATFVTDAWSEETMPLRGEVPADSRVLHGSPRVTLTPDTPVVTILIPVKNEGLNLTIMLKILRAVVDVPHEVLVVFDREGDESLNVVDTMSPEYPTMRAVRNLMAPAF